MRKDEARGDRRERLANALGIFLAQDGEDDGGAVVAKLLAPGLNENACAGRIMRAVDNSALVSALKTREPVHVR